MATLKQEFKVKETYSIKLVGAKRKAKYTFWGIFTVNGGLHYEFSGQGTTLWITDEDIESIEVAAPPKPRKAKPCQRCSGTGILHHVSHVQGGVCFKCGGTGTI